MHLLDKKSPADRPNVRSASQRKLGKDGTTWTPTEQRKRDRLMKQFSRMGRKGFGLTSNSPEFMENFDKIDWGKR